MNIFTIFQKYINNIFISFINKFIIIYLNNIFIFNKLYFEYK